MYLRVVHSFFFPVGYHSLFAFLLFTVMVSGCMLLPGPIGLSLLVFFFPASIIVLFLP
ncbi:hypothetical protein DFH27DRAFT_561541 [Peziza echinospora]|nr:hypothetical protein DFH27DRAFT_561541 [Peziza echinospora]